YLRSVDEYVAEGILEKEPRVDDEEADVQRALEESLNSIYDVPRGSLPPMVIREPESGKYQPLLEVQGKGKEKVTEEHVAHDLLTLQTPNKKSHVDQYIIQRSTSTPIGSFGHDESSSLYVELGLMDSEVESDEDVPRIDAGTVKAKLDQTLMIKMKARLDQTLVNKLKARLDQTLVHCNGLPEGTRESQLSVEEHMILEEPASSTGTLSSLQHLTKDLSFGDLFFNDKLSKADNEKTTAETEAESMVSFTIQLDTSPIPPMTTPVVDPTSRPESLNVHRPLQAMATETTTTTTTPPSQPQQSTIYFVLMKRIGELEHIMANLIQENKHLEDRLGSHGARPYTLENLDIPHQVSKSVDEMVTDAVDWAIQAPLRNRFRDLSEADMKEILYQRMWETNSYKTHKDHKMMYEALEKSMNRDHSEELAKDLAEARKKKKKRRDSPKTPLGSPPYQPPPTPPPAGPSGASGFPRAFGSSQVPPPPPPPPSTNQGAPDAQGQSSDNEDIENAHIPKTGDIAMFIDWFCKRHEITELKPQELEGSAFKLVKVFHPNVIHLQYQMEECHKLVTDSVDDSILRHNVSKPLPLGGPPGQVTIQSEFFFNKDLEYLRYHRKGSRPALSISKMKAAYYPGVGLEQLVPGQMWIEEECKHTSEGDRRVVRTHMRILSVVRIEVFSLYGYDYMKKIVLRRADLNEHIITERDFKYLYLSDFEDMYLLNLQDFQLGIESYQTLLNLTKPRWDATGSNNDEALDYRVKEFKKQLKTRRIFRNLESFIGGQVRDGDYRLLKRIE
nr:hypothetical protein [Tanacetum cinerariifolium]